MEMEDRPLWAIVERGGAFEMILYAINATVRYKLIIVCLSINACMYLYMCLYVVYAGPEAAV